MEALLVPLLLGSAPSRLRPAGLPPVGKRVNWFTSGNTGKPATQQFLLHDNRDVVDGVYTCCGVGGFEANGTLRLPELDYDGDIAPYREAPVGARGPCASRAPCARALSSRSPSRTQQYTAGTRASGKRACVA